MRLLILLPIVLTCCSSPLHVEQPPIERGNIRAWSQTEAERITMLSTRLEPRVRDLLASKRESASIWMTDLESINGSYGVCFEPMILLGTKANQFLPRVIAHELAHWHSFNDQVFPVILEEGLAIHVEVELGVFEAGEIHFDGDWMHVLSLDLDDWESVPGDEAVELYLAGYWLVNKIGLEELKAMYDQGETSPREVMEAAGLWQ
jgi:hypothetical protein